MKKIVIILSILFFVLLGAFELYVQSDAFAARIRPFVVQPLQDILGPDTQIGFVKANFFPPYLEVRDIVLADANGAVAATFHKIRIYINPVPLLFKKIRLPFISIFEPRVYALRAPDGTVNIKPLIERIKTNIARTGAGGASSYSLLLHTILVRQGEIRFKDETVSLQASVTDINMSARFSLANDQVAVNLRGAQVRVTAPAYPEIAGVLKASMEYNRGKFLLHSVDLTSGDASVTVTGDVGPLPDAVLDLKGRVRSGPKTLGKLADILKPAPKQRGSRIEASIVVKGKAMDPQIDGSFRFSNLTYKSVTLRDASLAFQYRDHVFSLNGEHWQVARNSKTLIIDRLSSTLSYRRGILGIQSLEVTAGDLTARMHGTIDPASGFDTHLSAVSSGAGRTISLMAPLQLEGMMTVEGHLAGALNAPVFEGSIEAGPLKTRGVQFDSISGKLEYGNKKITLSSIDIRHQSSHYILEGNVDFGAVEPVYSARLRVLQSDIVSIVALFYHPLPLHLSATGELTFQGTSQKYSGNGYLSIAPGSVYGESFTRGAITAVLTTGKITFPQVALYRKKGVVKGNGWIGFDGTYSADLEAKDISLSSVDHLGGIPIDGDIALDIHSSGNFSNPVAKASLNTEELFLRRVAVGQVHCEAELKDGQLRIAAELSANTVRLSARWLLRKPYAWTAEAKINTDNFNPVLLFGNKDISDRVKVSADGGISVHGVGLDAATVTGQAVFPRVSILVGEYRIENALPAAFAFDEGVCTIKSLNFSGPGTHIGVTGTTKVFADLNLGVKGTVNLPLLKLLLHEVEYSAGTAEIKLTVKDNWSNPDVAGELRIQDGEFKIRDIPQKFTALNGKVTFTQGRVATDSLSGSMGGGTLGISGWVQLAGISLQDFSIKTAVDTVTVRYPEGLTSTLSGNLYYDGNANEQTLSGDVLIKRARYDKRIEWKSMLVDIGRGLYQKKKTDIAWIGDTKINIRFHGSDNILLQNNLAKMPLDIDVFLQGTVNHPQLLGRVEARTGSVFFRKNDFKILHASVDFVDPNRMNPVLDIQAETQVREYQIRLAVTGTAERASVTLISDPALNDTDIFSLLALGKKGSELQGKETSIGVGEAASFATGQFQDIFERRARSLTGLDRFQIDPYVGKSDTSVPRVTVGKELIQNKLYVTYSSNVGASIPEQIFRIEYILDKHFSLVGERNEEMGNNGADIKYRFEFQ